MRDPGERCLQDLCLDGRPDRLGPFPHAGGGGGLQEPQHQLLSLHRRLQPGRGAPGAGIAGRPWGDPEDGGYIPDAPRPGGGRPQRHSRHPLPEAEGDLMSVVNSGHETIHTASPFFIESSFKCCGRQEAEPILLSLTVVENFDVLSNV